MSKNLVIVESPAKAKTISKFLGKDFKVEASIGHIRDLPSNAQEVPDKYKKEKWARLGVDTANDFKPLYIVPASKKKQVKKLLDSMKSASNLYLATDEDREGESISWHLLEVLKPKIPVKRLVFHEITKEAINEALKNPRDVDISLVHAQETRRILDRLYGYEVSPVLWRKIAPKLSAGRVQSVAIRLVVERERERIKFIPANYFDLQAEFATEHNEKFQTELKEIDGKKLVNGKDFNPETGKLKSKNKIMLDEKDAACLIKSIKKNKFLVNSIVQKPFLRHPEAPFTTSTMQQEAARKLHYSAKRTMQIAQKLYEHGFITYMRTDSTNLAESAIKEARRMATKLYGDEYISEQIRRYTSKIKNAQEAHEAIRPAGRTFQLPENLAKSGKVTPEEAALYKLIWKRTIASQMKDAKILSTIVEISDGKHVFGASGKQIVFAGFLKSYVQGSDDPEEELENQEKILPKMKEGERADLLNVLTKIHQTKPIARFTEASLIRELEARGIGRPSTYAAIMDTIVRREYVFKHGSALVPTFVAFAVVYLMEKHFSHLVDYQFTAGMESDLDKIANGDKKSVPYLKDFYFGTKGHKGLTDLINQEIDPKEVCMVEISPGGKKNKYKIRIGKFGPYLEHGTQKAPIPEDTIPAELDDEKIEEILEKVGRGQAGELVGKDKEFKLSIFKKSGRFGPYLQRGEKDDKGFKMKSIPRFISPEQLTLEQAIEILSWPKLLGKFKDGSEVFFDVGPYGPYLKVNGKNKAIPNGIDVMNLTLAEAEQIWNAASQTTSKKSFTANKVNNVIKDFQNGIVAKSGRYGIYVTDGKVNAAIPKGKTIEDITADVALGLIMDKKK